MGLDLHDVELVERERGLVRSLVQVLRVDGLGREERTETRVPKVVDFGARDAERTKPLHAAREETRPPHLQQLRVLVRRAVPVQGNVVVVLLDFARRASVLADVVHAPLQVLEVRSLFFRCDVPLVVR